MPAGITLCDAAEILNPNEFFVYQDGPGKGSPAGFANLFRYKLLTEKGGWWVDTDVLCLSDDMPALSEFFAAEDDTLINNAVLLFRRRHPLMTRCFDEAKQMGRAVRWGETGPFLLTRLINEFGYRDRTRPPNLCYPLHHYRVTDVLRPSQCARLIEQTKSSLFVHFYNASLLLRGVEKNKAPPSGSILHRWLEEHAVDGWEGAYDEETVERTLVPP